LCAGKRKAKKAKKKNTESREPQKRRKRHFDTPRAKAAHVSSELWDSEVPVGKIQQLWLCKEYCSFNDLHVK
jgi:hypothetical protein